MRIRSMMVVCAFLTVCVTQSGCLVSHSRHSVIRQGEPLQHMAFQSEQAQSAFENHVQSQLNDTDNRSKSSLAVPFLLGLENTRRLSEAAIRNDAAARFDTNVDGVIAESEVGLSH